jgi:hypothetical protein
VEQKRRSIEGDIVVAGAAPTATPKKAEEEKKSRRYISLRLTSSFHVILLVLTHTGGSLPP